MQNKVIHYLTNNPNATVLIIRFSAIGDIIQISAFSEYIHQKFPQATIEWITKKQFVPLVERMPSVSKVYGYDSTSGISGLVKLIKSLPGYDIVCDMHAVFRSVVVRNLVSKKLVIKYKKPYGKRWLLFYWGIDRFLSEFHVVKDYIRTFDTSFDWKAEVSSKIIASEGDTQYVSTFLKEKQLYNYAAFVVGAAWQQKCWPHDYFVTLGKYFLDHGIDTIVLVGGPQDAHCQEIAKKIGKQAIAVQGTLTVEQSTTLCAQATLVFGNDTGVMHGVEAMGKDVAVVLGPTSRHTGAYPLRKSSIIFEKQLPCRPCSQKGDRKCQLPYQMCMYAITPEYVFAVLYERWLKQ